MTVGREFFICLHVDAVSGLRSLMARKGLGHCTRLGRFWLWSNLPQDTPTQAAVRSRNPVDLADATAAELTATGLRITRGMGGGPPLYYCRTPVPLVGTRLELLVLAGQHYAIEPLAAACWFGGVGTFPDGRTPYAGVYSLFPGAQLNWTDRTLKLVEPSLPRQVTSPSSPERLAELATQVRDTLTDAVATAATRGSILVCCSGGVDSTLLLKLAERQKAQPAAYSLLPPDHLPCWPHEAAMIALATTSLPLGRVQLQTLSEEVWISAVRARPPSLFPSYHHCSVLLPSTLRGPAPTTVLRGEFADEIFGSHLRLAEWLQRVLPSDALAKRAPSPLGRLTALKLLRARLFPTVLSGGPPRPELPALFASDLRARYRSWRHQFRNTRDGLARWDRRDGMLADAWETRPTKATTVGFPYMSPKLLLMGYQLHPADLFGPETKRLLRMAASGLLPPIHQARKDKGRWTAFGGQDSHPFPQLTSAAESLLCPDWLEKHHKRRLKLGDALRLTSLQHMLTSLELERRNHA